MGGRTTPDPDGLGDVAAWRVSITFYLVEGLRDRARAAYRSTSIEEQDRSWSEMLAKALLAEVQRRENEYNAGEPFAGGDEPLSPGRPLGS
ncbi:ParB family protein [Leifsonia poae]|uniref:ParB family protein n=1 Tax=Leifsonia poae TaxID=110933 RepID=UPI003D67C42C